MKRIYEVGDTIKKRKNLGRLPIHSVVLNRQGKPMLISALVTVSIYNKTFFYEGEDNGPYTVVHVGR